MKTAQVGPIRPISQLVSRLFNPRMLLIESVLFTGAPSQKFPVMIVESGFQDFPLQGELEKHAELPGLYFNWSMLSGVGRTFRES